MMVSVKTKFIISISLFNIQSSLILKNGFTDLRHLFKPMNLLFDFLVMTKSNLFYSLFVTNIIPQQNRPCEIKQDINKHN
ncbi:hypothetical protein BpHYR1_008436 [Brachionus plicatilis]|uniref:Uncharacterized protein n=1 Tax=Brachionus plicatilis TaxID=10195 RepID=A0A3M7SBB0_BRAPC|nr:hypothetical protein BpHYR1_008436 [Brachionus plicatilis]